MKDIQEKEPENENDQAFIDDTLNLDRNIVKRRASHKTQTEIKEENEEQDDSDIEDLAVFHEGELFSLYKDNDKSGIVKFRKFYMSIINTSIYYYQQEKDPKEKYFKSHYIDGSFVKENLPEKFGGKDFYSFTIKFPNQKKRQYFHTDQTHIKEWIKKLRESIVYQNFFDYYTLQSNTIGKGQYGVVKLGFNTKTNEKVAVKILEKENIKTKDDWNLIKTEIDILKHSTHENIVKFYDHFENSDYIFLVMEYINNGNLQEYLIKKKFKIPESELIIIAYQMVDALKYLHSYGVIHRDFKPENIMLKKSDDGNFQIKLMDFGLSKIIGFKEKATEGYGTMAFVAPEVISKKPYDTSIDIWSFGITLYYMFSGDIPFIAKEKGESTPDLILKKELEFTSKFKNCSNEVIDLISQCLIKTAKNRISINDLFNHSWFRNTKLIKDNK